VQAFTAGIYKPWLVMDDRLAAAQLATLLLGTVGLLPVILLSRTMVRRR
jgi:iron(III) transport system permease protein